VTRATTRTTTRATRRTEGQPNPTQSHSKAKRAPPAETKPQPQHLTSHKNESTTQDAHVRCTMSPERTGAAEQARTSRQHGHATPSRQECISAVAWEEPGSQPDSVWAIGSQNSEHGKAPINQVLVAMNSRRESSLRTLSSQNLL
jgi:hypothetical protein